MLPYGTLWKLDHMMHPAGPRRAKTARTRRRQALFFLVLAVIGVSLFLFPFHFARLRHLRIRHSLEVAGISETTVAPGRRAAQAQAGLDALRRALRQAGASGSGRLPEGGEGPGGAFVAGGVGERLLRSWAAAFAYGGAAVPRVRGTYAAEVAGGGGAGVHWRYAAATAGDDTEFNAVLYRRMTGAADAATDIAPSLPVAVACPPLRRTSGAAAAAETTGVSLFNEGAAGGCVLSVSVPGASASGNAGRWATVEHLLLHTSAGSGQLSRCTAGTDEDRSGKDVGEAGVAAPPDASYYHILYCVCAQSFTFSHRRRDRGMNCAQVCAEGAG